MEQDAVNPAELPATEAAPDATDPAQAPQLNEGAEPDAPQLSDEDYRLNFLGTHKFELARETPDEIRQALKELEGSLNRGWTEKTTKLADLRKEVAAQQQQMQVQLEAERASMKEMAQFEALQEQIKAYDEVNWPAWIDQDPVAAQKALATLNTLKNRHGQLTESIQAKQREALQSRQQQAVEWLTKADQQLSTKIKDWSDSKRSTIADFVTTTYLNTGTPADHGAYQALSWHPGLIEMAEDARLYRESLKRATAVKPNAPAPQPVSKVGGTAQAAKDPSKMTDKEWFAWRQQDLANKRKAENFKR